MLKSLMIIDNYGFSTSILRLNHNKKSITIYTFTLSQQELINPSLSNC